MRAQRESGVQVIAISNADDQLEDPLEEVGVMDLFR